MTGAADDYRWETFLALGRQAFERGDAMAAADAFSAAVDEAEGFGPHDERLAMSLNNLAAVRRLQGDLEEGSRLLKRSLGIAEAILGQTHPEVAVARSNLAAVREAAGDAAEAEQYFRQAAESAEQAHSPDDVDLPGRCWANLAAFLATHGRYEQAMDAQRRSVSLRSQRLGMTSPRVGEALLELSDYELLAGESEQARQTRERGLGILGADLEAAECLLRLAVERQTSGRFESALGLFRQALEIMQERLAPNHPALADAQEGLAANLAGLGRVQEAEQACLRTLEIRLAAFGPTDPRVAASHRNLAGLRGQLQRWEEAADDFQEAIRVWKSSLGQDHPLVSSSLGELGELLLEAGRFREARECLDEAVELLRRLDAAGSALATALGRAGLAAFQDRDPSSAAGRFQEALQLWREVPAAPPSALASALYNLASALHAQGDTEPAQELYQQALDGARRELGADNSLTARIVLNYAHLLRDVGQVERARALEESLPRR